MQTYTCKKAAERRLKRVLDKKHDPSSIGPTPYAHRFIQFWECHIIDDEVDKEIVKEWPEPINNYYCCCCFT